jgi:osomolarity two-component system, response regulator SKN7
MPKLDGVSATSHLRRRGDRTLVVAMTSATRPNEIEKYLSIGMDDVMGKPFTKNNLLRVLKVMSFLSELESVITR